MRNTTRLAALEAASTHTADRRIFITSDDWLRSSLYLDCSRDDVTSLSVFICNDPATLPDEVAARVVNQAVVTAARDAGDNCTVIRYGAWPPASWC